MRHLCLVLILSTSSTQFAPGQTREEISAANEVLIQNKLKLDVSMTVDRPVYFAGESGEITITVKNNTQAALQVLEPFNSITGCIDLLRKVSTTYELVAPEPACNGYVEMVLPSIVMAPGGQLTQTISSSDPFVFGLPTPVFSATSFPQDAGDYALRYQFAPNSPVMFSVVAPKVEAATVIRVEDIEDPDPPPGQQPETAPQYVHLFALRWENKSYLCATLNRTTQNRLLTGDANGNLDFAKAAMVAGYVRINGQTSSLPIVSITGTADANGNLSVVWRDSGGTDHNVYIPNR